MHFLINIEERYGEKFHLQATRRSTTKSALWLIVVYITERYTMSSKQLFDLLPSQLRNFFKKYPPSIQYASKPTSTHAIDANPFLPNKHPVTNRYHDPKYSLRRMSDLYKMASLYGVQELLPPRNKMFFEEKYNNKKMMKGVLMPKGHKHELVHDEKMAKMADAIRNADRYILEVKGSKYRRRIERKQEEQKTTWFWMDSWKLVYSITLVKIPYLNTSLFMCI